MARGTPGDLGVCLGDLYSVSWIELADAVDLEEWSLQKQFKAIRARTSAHHTYRHVRPPPTSAPASARRVAGAGRWHRCSWCYACVMIRSSGQRLSASLIPRRVVCPSGGSQSGALHVPAAPPQRLACMCMCADSALT